MKTETENNQADFAKLRIVTAIKDKWQKSQPITEDKFIDIAYPVLSRGYEDQIKIQELEGVIASFANKYINIELGLGEIDSAIMETIIIQSNHLKREEINRRVNSVANKLAIIKDAIDRSQQMVSQKILKLKIICTDCGKIKDVDEETEELYNGKYICPECWEKGDYEDQL